LAKAVVEGKYDVGLATDGDADRFGVMDERGIYYSPNQLLALLLRHLVKNRKMKGAVVRTVATSHLLDRLAELYGLELIETPVGFKYVGHEMREKDVLIGGEESGGVSIKGHIPEKDGILGNLLIVEMMAFEKKPLSVIWNDLLNEAELRLVGRRRDLHLNATTQKQLMDRLREKPFETIGEFKVAQVNRLDGLKFLLDEHNWVLVRPSGTEPVIRLYFECSSDERADSLLTAFQAEVDKILAGIEGGDKLSGALKLASRA